MVKGVSNDDGYPLFNSPPPYRDTCNNKSYHHDAKCTENSENARGESKDSEGCETGDARAEDLSNPPSRYLPFVLKWSKKKTLTTLHRVPMADSEPFLLTAQWHLVLGPAKESGEMMFALATQFRLTIAPWTAALRQK